MNLRKLLFAVAFIIQFSGCSAQKSSPLWEQYKDKSLKNISKRNVGPAAMSGRITAIAVPNLPNSIKPDRNTLYVGAASGGVWKSTNGGLSWQAIFDEMDVQSIGALAVNPLNPDEIWAGTGEGNPRNSHNSGKGIYRSLDGGKTWKCMGLEATRNIHRILFNPINTKQIYVAAFGNIWGPHPERGVYKSNDGGETWERILFSNEFSGCAELIMDPQNPEKLFAGLYDHHRLPWTFRSGGVGSGMYVTYNGGKDWKKLGVNDGLPEGDLGRIGLAIPQINSNRVYALIEAKKSGFYRSNDGGKTWKFVTDVPNAGNRPFYYHEIYAHPYIEDRVYSIWSQISQSKNGGDQWEIMADWGTIHPDHHAFLIHPKDPDYIINGNDGGIAISYDGGKTWRFAENIPVGQYYHIDIDKQVPYNIYGGLQDNGSWIGPAFHWKRGPIKNHQWQEVLFGDGFDVAPILEKPGQGYAMWQGGNVYHFNTLTHQALPIKPQHPEGKHLRFNWNAAIAIDPFHTDGLYFGSQYLHHSTDNGQSWKIISPDLTTNDSSKLKQAESGGLTTDATGAENHCTILSIGVAHKNKNILWVGTDDGQIQFSDNQGKTWNLVSKNIKGLPKNAWIPYLWVSPEGRECWAVVNQYRQNDWNPYVFVTTDAGLNWKNVTQKHQIKFEGIHQEMGYVHTVLPHPSNKNLVFLGSDRGLWISFDRAENWYKWTQGFPSVPVSDLKFNEQFHDLVVGTFGRGAWVFDDIRPLERLTKEGNLPDKTLEIIHCSEGYLANYMGNSGQHYQTADHFGAPNKNTQVNIHFWLSPEKVSPKNKIKLVGEIYDERGIKIRKHHFSVDSAGLNQISWRMIRDGFRFPSHENSEGDSTLPPGIEVFPGKYKLLIRNEGDTLKFADSSFCMVLSSGQSKPESVAYEKKLTTVNAFAKTVKRAFNSFENLKTAESNLKKLDLLNYESDSTKKAMMKISKTLLDKIDTLKLQFMLPKDYRYYEDATLRLNDVLYQAWEYLQGNPNITENALVAINIASQFTERIENQTEDFLSNLYLPVITALEKEGQSVRWFKPLRK
jgi:photosystem II stability/assembly factor-like uncharacterized protein